MRYAWIASQEGTFAIKAMCRVLKGWCNGYYAWTQRTPGGREVGTIKLSAWTKFFVSGSKPIKDGMVHLG